MLTTCLNGLNGSDRIVKVRVNDRIRRPSTARNLSQFHKFVNWIPETGEGMHNCRWYAVSREMRCTKFILRTLSRISYSGIIVQRFLRSRGTVNSHLTYSPDLAPADMFCSVKCTGKSCDNLTAACAINVTAKRSACTVDAFNDCFVQLLKL
jgi:hypothetical protein